MKKTMIQIAYVVLLFVHSSFLQAWQWSDLWRTADQQGARLLHAGKAEQAAHVFKNQNWQAVAWYRAHHYQEALKRFKSQKNSDGQYNAGNAAAYLGRYKEAMEAYDKAIALNPHNTDAIINREIIKKLMDQDKQQNKSSDSSAQNEKNNTENKSDHKPSAPKQNQEKTNSAENKDETKNKQTNSQKNSGQNNQSQQNNTHLQPSENSDGDRSNSKQEQVPASVQRQAKEEGQNQLLRRLPDDPGGLLQQKFLRDYIRRHSADPQEGGI